MCSYHWRRGSRTPSIEYVIIAALGAMVLHVCEDVSVEGALYWDNVLEAFTKQWQLMSSEQQEKWWRNLNEFCDEAVRYGAPVDPRV